ncbi:hypothetical protein BaRGS_00009726, partial [Batillaria attramentaria]
TQCVASVQWNGRARSRGLVSGGHAHHYSGLQFLRTHQGDQIHRQGFWTPRDSVLLTIVCEGTSIYGGFAIFSVLGYMAHQSGVPIEKVVSSADYRGNVPDHSVRLLSPFHRKIPHSGYRPFLRLLHTYWPCLCHSGWSLRVPVGADRFGEDIEMMIGRKPPMLFKILWCFVTPFCVAVLLCFTLAQYTPPTYGNYHYETWAVVIGWIIAFSSFVPVPVVAIYQLCNAKGTFLERLRQTTTPDDQWGPASLRKRRVYQKAMLQRPPRSSCLDIIRN